MPSSSTPYESRLCSKSLLWSVLFVCLAVGLYFRLSWPTFNDFFRAMDFCDVAFCDFVKFYYEMGKEIFLNKSPFPGFHYSPFFALVLGAFGAFPSTIATTAWVILLLACSIGLFIVSYRIVFPTSSPSTLVGFLAVFLVSYPILHNFTWGQVSVLLVLLIMLTLFAYEKGRWLLAAFFLAFATSLKFYPALFILPFVFMKEWRLVFAFFGWCIVLFILIPVVTLGTEPTFSFLDQIVNFAFSKQRASRASNSQFFANVLTRWASAFELQGGAYEIFLRTMGLLVLEINLALSFVLLWLKYARAMQWSFVLLFLSLPFLVATSWPHYLVFVPFCQLFLFSDLLAKRAVSKSRSHILMTSGLALSVALSSVVMLQLVGGWKIYNSAGLLFVADAILIALCYGVLVPSLILSFTSSQPANHRVKRVSDPR